MSELLPNVGGCFFDWPSRVFPLLMRGNIGCASSKNAHLVLATFAYRYSDGTRGQGPGWSVTLVKEKRNQGRQMPATVPSGCPKDGASWSQAGKADPNSMSGGRSSGTTRPSKDEKGKGLEIKGAGCRLTHVTTGNDDGSSTSWVGADD